MGRCCYCGYCVCDYLERYLVFVWCFDYELFETRLCAKDDDSMVVVEVVAVVACNGQKLLAFVLCFVYLLRFLLVRRMYGVDSRHNKRKCGVRKTFVGEDGSILVFGR